MRYPVFTNIGETCSIFNPYNSLCIELVLSYRYIYSPDQICILNFAYKCSKKIYIHSLYDGFYISIASVKVWSLFWYMHMMQVMHGLLLYRHNRLFEEATSLLDCLGFHVNLRFRKFVFIFLRSSKPVDFGFCLVMKIIDTQLFF